LKIINNHQLLLVADNSGANVGTKFKRYREESNIVDQKP